MELLYFIFCFGFTDYKCQQYNYNTVQLHPITGKVVASNTSFCI